MANAPEASMAASTESVAYELRALLGLANMGSVLSFAYATTHVLPQRLPDSTLAKDSLDQALLLAEHLSRGAAAKLIAHAKGARQQRSLSPPTWFQ
jgi:MFS transporter, DHA2 family, multidrug resistance protein